MGDPAQKCLQKMSIKPRVKNHETKPREDPSEPFQRKMGKFRLHSIPLFFI